MEFFYFSEEAQLRCLNSESDLRALTTTLFTNQLMPFSLRLVSSMSLEKRVFLFALERMYKRNMWSDWPGTNGCSCLHELVKHNGHLAGDYIEFLMNNNGLDRLKDEMKGVFQLCLRMKRFDYFKTIYRSGPRRMLLEMELEATEKQPGPITLLFITALSALSKYPEHPEEITRSLAILEDALSFLVEAKIEKELKFSHFTTKYREVSTAVHLLPEMTEYVIVSPEWTRTWILVYIYLTILVHPSSLGLLNSKGESGREMLIADKLILPGIIKDTTQREQWTFNIRVDTFNDTVSIWNLGWSGQWKFSARSAFGFSISHALAKGCGAFFAVLHVLIAFETDIEDDKDIYYTEDSPITFVYEGDENPYIENCVFQALMIMGHHRLLSSYKKVIVGKGKLREVNREPPTPKELTISKKVMKTVFPNKKILVGLLEAFIEGKEDNFLIKMKGGHPAPPPIHPTLKKMAVDLCYINDEEGEEESEEEEEEEAQGDENKEPDTGNEEDNHSKEEEEQGDNDNKQEKEEEEEV